MVGFLDFILNKQTWLQEATEIDVVKCSQPYDKIHDTIYTASDMLLEQCINTMNFNSFGGRPYGSSNQLLEDPDELLENLEVQYDDLLEDDADSQPEQEVDSVAVNNPVAVNYPDFNIGEFQPRGPVESTNVNSYWRGLGNWLSVFFFASSGFRASVQTFPL